MSESTNTHFESRTGWRVLWPTNELIWYSQRNDWGQFYLYDLNTGAMKRKITSAKVRSLKSSGSTSRRGHCGTRQRDASGVRTRTLRIITVSVSTGETRCR